MIQRQIHRRRSASASMVAARTAEDRLKLAIESFSILTGFSFVFSGLFNAGSFFAMWRLNYFLIASPSDVVMSGFISVTMLTLIAGLVVLTAWLFGLFYKLFKFVARDQVRSLERVAKAVRTPWVRQGLTAMARFYDAAGNNKLFAAYMAASFLVSIPAGIAVVLGKTVGSPVIPYAQFMVPIWTESGLKVASDSQIDGCGGAHVAWIGASAAILECSDGLRVLHNLDDLQTVPRRR